MTKLLDCPECGAKGIPKRDDAEVCSTRCRVARHRRVKQKDKQTNTTGKSPSVK